MCPLLKKEITLSFFSYSQVDTIQKKLAESKSKIKVKMLMDFCRSSRGTTNSRTILKDLVEQHPDDCRVCCKTKEKGKKARKSMALV